MKKIIYIILIISFSLSTFSQEVLTFRKAVENLLMNNYSIRLSKINQQIANNNVIPGKAGMAPKVDLTSSYTLSNTEIELDLATGQKIINSGNTTKTYNAGVQISQTLFDGMAMFVNLDKLEEFKNKSDIELKITIEGAVQSLASAYIQALKLQNTLLTLKKNLEQSNDRLQRLEIKKDYGAALQLEVLRAKVDKNADSSNYLKTELSYRNSIKNINFLMGNNIEANFVLDTFKVDEVKELAKIREDARNNNNSILRAISNKQISEYDKKLVLSTFFPRISLTGGYTISGQESDAGFILLNQSNGVNGTISLSWNLYNGKQDEINRQNAELAIKMNEITEEQLRQQIDLNVLNNYDTYTRRLEILKFEKENLATAQLNFDRTNELFNMGLATSIELRQAQINLSASEIKIIDAELDTIQSLIDLKILSGDKVF